MQGKRTGVASWFGAAFFLVLYDACAVNAAYLIALFIRFDFQYSAIPWVYLAAFRNFAPIYTLLSLIIFYRRGLYRSLWQYASYSEIWAATIAAIELTLLQSVGITLFFHRMPLSYYVFGALTQYFLVVGIRFSYRFILLLRKNEASEENNARIMLIGAGSAGRMILHDVNRTPRVQGRVVCIIDDNPKKQGRSIDGIPIVGDRNTILENVKKYHITSIYLAIPSAPKSVRRDILAICEQTDCELKNLPGMYQLVLGQVKASEMQAVSVEDLLGRDSVQVDLEGVFSSLKDKTVLVTGAGGSIGSELCRQIAGCEPKMLVMVDCYENNVYDIQLELKDRYPWLNLAVLIASVRDSRRMHEIFAQYRPNVVYHAAAHKHVPLMEDSPCEAIKNNVLGTYKTAYAALCYGCEHFVLISTDKAVNPTNIMGASKRLCEMIIQSFAFKVEKGLGGDMMELFTHREESPKQADEQKNKRNMLNCAHTQFVAVRFGNVLGSNGSVIPIFKRQIAKGGPVTVTHPDIIRYFMTIPEAVSLVLEAGSLAKGGEIFVLDMGSPVKIDTLARNLIRLCGYKPDVDIKVEYSGLRPGEKLYEERLMTEEGLQKTPNDLIFIGSPIPFDVDVFMRQLNVLMESAYENREDIKEMVAQMICTYHPEKAGEIGIGE